MNKTDDPLTRLRDSILKAHDMYEYDDEGSERLRNFRDKQLEKFQESNHD